ncbi:MAG TPA: polymer-forming cytoskeletal protein [Bryobacteraceae bacterium]|nr:polymer-forming cytoskeletal protein [Bryobacteraceae bacterium]
MPVRPQPEPGRSPTLAGSAQPAAPPPRPEPAAPAPRTQPPAPAQRSQSAAIGSSMHIKGDIRTREELLVDGEVEGTVESHSLLTVGPNGKVHADIKAREVVIFGAVEGNVEVAEKLAIRGQGSLVGNIKTAGISIDDGAYFKGSIDIVRPEPRAATRAMPAPESDLEEKLG